MRRAWPAGATRDGVDSLCADRPCCALSVVRGSSGSGGARSGPSFWEVRRACDPNPNLYTAHARAAASALRCARARFRPLLRRREGARVARRLVARSVALRVVRAPCSVRGVRAARQATRVLTPHQQNHAKELRLGSVKAPPWPPRGVRTRNPLYNLILNDFRFKGAAVD